MPAAQPAFSDRHSLTSETKPLYLRRGQLVSAGLSPALNWGVQLPGRLELNLAGVGRRMKSPSCQGSQLLALWALSMGVSPKKCLLPRPRIESKVAS